MAYPVEPVYGRAAGLPAETLPGEAIKAGPEEAADNAAVPCVVVVGSASRDLDPADPRGWRLGGAVAYGALVLARLGVRTGALVGVDAETAAAPELDLLRDAGVDLVPVHLPSAPVFDLQETPAGRLQRCLQPGHQIPVGPMPPGWRRAPAWLLAPVADELPDGWAAIPAGALVALGWQGLLRELVAGERVGRRPPAPHPLVHRADLVSVSVTDLGGEPSLAEVLAPLRPGALCAITHGARGGIALVVRRDRPHPRARWYPALPSVAVDTTGAGDAFLAALLAARVVPALTGRVPQLSTALRFAAAVAAVHVTGRGLAGVPTLAAVRRRLGAMAADPPGGDPAAANLPAASDPGSIRPAAGSPSPISQPVDGPGAVGPLGQTADGPGAVGPLGDRPEAISPPA